MRVSKWWLLLPIFILMTMILGLILELNNAIN